MADNMSFLPVPYYLPFAVNFLQLLTFLILPNQVFSINRNIGIVFSSLPESRCLLINIQCSIFMCFFRVAPPGDRVFFDCKTNIGKGEFSGVLREFVSSGNFPGEQIRWLHNGNRLDKQTKYVKIGDGELTIRVSANNFVAIIFTFSIASQVRKSKRHLEGQTGRYQCVAGLEGRLLMSPPAKLEVAHLEKFPDRSDLPTKIEANVGNNVLISCGIPESNPPAIIQVLIFKNPLLDLFLPSGRETVRW